MATMLLVKCSASYSSMSLATIARLVLYNRTQTAQKLTGRSLLAAKHISVQNGTVSLKDPAAFELEYATFKARALDEELRALQQIQLIDNSPKWKRQGAALENRSKLWKTGVKKLVLSGIVGNDMKVREGSGQTPFGLERLSVQSLHKAFRRFLKV